MAPACPLPLTFFSCCILLLLLLLLLETICCSGGVFVELSYDSTQQVKIPSSSVVTECRVMVTDQQRAYLFLKPLVCREKKPCRPEPLAAAAGKLVNEVLGPDRNRRLLNRVAPSAVAMAKLGGDTGRREKRRLLGVVVDVPSSPPRRELGEARATARDEFSPLSNPAATTPVSNPVTVPATNPVATPMAPGFVTVPSTNPNLPPLYPGPTPVTTPMPDPTTTMPPATVPPPFPTTNPVAAPTATMPGTGTGTGTVTNPATTPSFQGASPVTNPVTTYPYPQQGGVGVGVGGGMGMPATQPVYQAPATTMPGTGTVGGQAQGQGQAWCVAKSGLMDTTLQEAMDYACGMGGADCSAIQPMGACYNPNTLQAHASYAFNSYFQRNPSAASCDFGGAGMLVNVNPSSGTCMYQTSSSGFGAGYSPGTTTGGGGGVPSGYVPGTSGTGYNPAGGMSGTMGGGPGGGSTVLNANNPGGNSMYGGYDSQTGLTSGSPPSPSCGRWVLPFLVCMLTFAFVKEKM